MSLLAGMLNKVILTSPIALIGQYRLTTDWVDPIYRDALTRINTGEETPFTQAAKDTMVVPTAKEDIHTEIDRILRLGSSGQKIESTSPGVTGKGTQTKGSDVVDLNKTLQDLLDRLKDTKEDYEKANAGYDPSSGSQGKDTTTPAAGEVTTIIEKHYIERESSSGMDAFLPMMIIMFMMNMMGGLGAPQPQQQQKQQTQQDQWWYY